MFELHIEYFYRYAIENFGVLAVSAGFMLRATRYDYALGLLPFAGVQSKPPYPLGRRR